MVLWCSIRVKQQTCVWRDISVGNASYDITFAIVPVRAVPEIKPSIRPTDNYFGLGTRVSNGPCNGVGTLPDENFRSQRVSDTSNSPLERVRRDHEPFGDNDWRTLYRRIVPSLSRRVCVLTAQIRRRDVTPSPPLLRFHTVWPRARAGSVNAFVRSAVGPSA